MNNNNEDYYYRYQFERYRGRNTRHTVVNKHIFSILIYNDYIYTCVYILENGWLVGQKHRENNQTTTPQPQPTTITPLILENGWLVGQNYRENNQTTTPKPQPTTITPLPRWFMEQSSLNFNQAKRPTKQASPAPDEAQRPTKGVSPPSQAGIANPAISYRNTPRNEPCSSRQEVHTRHCRGRYDPWYSYLCA